MTRLLHEYVREQAERRPQARAVELREESLTYGELERLSDQLAAALHAAGCRRGDRVCILQNKSPRAVLSIIGTLKADCIYTPIDPSNPPPRLLMMLQSTAPAVLLTDRMGARALQRVPHDARSSWGRLAWMDAADAPADLPPPEFTLADVARSRLPPPAVRNHAGALAHILFTSGSTGAPKGVTITHANVVAFIDWATSYFALGPHDRLSGHSPFHFDLSTFDIFGALAAGARLHLVPAELNLLPTKLAEFIRDTELTQWFSVPSILAHLAKWDVVRERDFPALRRVLWCGEVFPTPSLIYWMKRLPHASFTNLYGPTEATIASSYYSVPSRSASETAEVPIGRPCPGEDLLVLGDHCERLGRGAVGELHISGVGLSPGYWNDEERTRQVFVRDPETGVRLYRTGDLARVGDDGLVYLLGRADFQIKSRGYRIDLGEVEAALATLDYLTESAAFAVDSNGFEGKLVGCAYVGRDNGEEIAASRIRRDLQGKLPPYMIPQRWLALDRLPRNANGKVDRRALGGQLVHHEAAPR